MPHVLRVRRLACYAVACAAPPALGALARVGRSWLFAEARVVTYPSWFGAQYTYPRGMLPMMVGVRF